MSFVSIRLRRSSSMSLWQDSRCRDLRLIGLVVVSCNHYTYFETGTSDTLIVHLLFDTVHITLRHNHEHRSLHRLQSCKAVFHLLCFIGASPTTTGHRLFTSILGITDSIYKALQVREQIFILIQNNVHHKGAICFPASLAFLYKSVEDILEYLEKSQVPLKGREIVAEPLGVC